MGGPVGPLTGWDAWGWHFGDKQACAGSGQHMVLVCNLLQIVWQLGPGAPLGF